MSDKTHDTIIIGAGISGLACARHLSEHEEDFLVICKDIGGRLLVSNDGTTNYGAFFVCSDYDNVLKYATCKSRIRLGDFCFHEKDITYVLLELKIIPYIYQFIKVEKLLFKFRKKLRFLRKRSINISQKLAIESDSFLYKLYMQEAVDFVKEHSLEKGFDIYLSKALYSTTFSKIDEMNAFSLLQFLIPLITPIYSFNFEKEKMIKTFKDRIKIREVSDIKFKDEIYKVKCGNEYFHSKNIVLATEINWSKHFAGVKNTNKSVSTNMLHIKGSPRKIISKKKYQLFSPSSNVQAAAYLEDGTFLLYYKNKYPDLEKFFVKPEVIAQKSWNYAGTINGHNLIECNRGNNMYLIGDYNIAGLEESYITGLFCANQIISSH
jgi:hypothetical protein